MQSPITHRYACELPQLTNGRRGGQKLTANARDIRRRLLRVRGLHRTVLVLAT